MLKVLLIPIVIIAFFCGSTNYLFSNRFKDVLENNILYTNIFITHILYIIKLTNCYSLLHSVVRSFLYSLPIDELENLHIVNL